MIKGPLVFIVRIPWSLSCQQNNTHQWKFHHWNNNFLLTSQLFSSCQFDVQFKTVNWSLCNHCSLYNHLDIQMETKTRLSGICWLVGCILNNCTFSIIFKNIQSGNYSMVKFLSQDELDLYFISYTSLNMFPINYQLRSSLVQTFYMKT